MDSTSPHHSHNKKPSTSDLFSSAKVVADAAISAFNRDPENLDKAKAASAAANLLDGIAHYGNLEENQYVQKADTYLHEYSSKPSTAPHSTHAPVKTSHSVSEDDPSSESGGGYGDYTKMGKQSSHGSNTSAHSTHASGHGSHAVSEDESEGGGGYGQYIKMAQGYLNQSSDHKPNSTTGHSTQPSGHGSHSDQSESGGGYGEYIKMAQGLMNQGSHSTQASGHGSHTSGEDQSESGAGYGDYIKMAQGFLKK